VTVDAVMKVHIMTNEPGWFTRGQLARQLKVSCRSLERMRLDGTGPRFAKAGRRVLCRVDFVDNWLETRSFLSKAQAKAARAR
jgi:hypothetical protein